MVVQILLCPGQIHHATEHIVIEYSNNLYIFQLSIQILYKASVLQIEYILIGKKTFYI